MKKLSTISIISMSLLFMACSNTGDISKESSKPAGWNTSSPVVLTEYADFECPACKAAHAQIVSVLKEEYGDKVRYEFNHFPIRSIHRHALDAAKAAECAADQGKFWEYVDYNYEHQADMAPAIFKEWAKEIGVADLDLFDRCQKSDVKKDVILEDYNTGRALGVAGTPSFFVNGEKIDTDIAIIRSTLDAASRNAIQRL